MKNNTQNNFQITIRKKLFIFILIFNNGKRELHNSFLFRNSYLLINIAFLFVTFFADYIFFELDTFSEIFI